MNWAGFLILGEACFFFGFPWPEGKKCPYYHEEGYARVGEDGAPQGRDADGAENW